MFSVVHTGSLSRANNDERVQTNQSNHDSQSEQWNNHVKKRKFMVKTSKPLEAWENA